MLKIIPILFFITCNLFSAFELIYIDPNCMGIGSISSFETPSAFSCLIFQKSPVIRFSYEMPFGLTELSRESVGVSFSAFDDKKFYLSVVNFGNKTYRENSFTFAYALLDDDSYQFTPSISWYLLQAGGVSYYSLALNIAAYYKVSNLIEIITAINNLYSLRLVEDEKLPMYYTFDLRFKLNNNFYLYSGIEKDIKYEAVVKAGLEYKPLSFLSLMGGYNFEPELYSGGFEIQFESFRFGYAFSYHTILDFTHATGVIYEF